MSACWRRHSANGWRSSRSLWRGRGLLAKHLADPPPAELLPRLNRLDDDTQVPALYDIGLRVGDALIKREHFRDCFDPAVT